MQNERTSLKLEYSTIFRVRIFDLLGPEDPGIWAALAEDYSRDGAAAAGGTAGTNNDNDDDDDDEVDMDEELLLADEKRNANIISSYRDRSLSWVMIVATPKSATLAVKLFRLLSRKGVPAWVAQYSGAHATEYDRLMDGVLGAAIICPILTSDFAEDSRARHALELAANEKLPIHAIIGERAFKPTGTLAGAPSVAIWATMDPERELRPALEQLIAGATEHGRIRILDHPVTGQGERRERRLSGSQMHQGALDRHGPTGDSHGPSVTLEGRLRKECGLAEEDVVKYMTLLRASFREQFKTEADSNIFHYDREDLMDVGITKLHAKCVLKEVEKMQAANQPFTAAMAGAGAPLPALDWPAPVLRHLFKVNCFDILNKSHRSATLENLKTILDRFAKSPATRLFVSHCTQDEGMQLFNTAELYFSEKGHKVFNPTTEFQKIEASTPTMVAAVRASQVVIAALSPKLFTSKWCLAELVAAHDADIPVVAVFAGDFCSNAQMERWVGGNFN